MISIKNSPVPHLQNEWEWDTWVKHILIPTNPKRIIEIGSFYGATLWSMIQNAPELEKIVSVDYPIGPNDGRYNEMLESKAKWKDWGGKIVEIQGDSHKQETLERVRGVIKDVDILFIDGDHTYSGVSMDYAMYNTLVKYGGIIAFHDSVGIDSVKQFTDELEKQNTNFIKISQPPGWGIFTLVK